jgi:hypothetical protein
MQSEEVYSHSIQSQFTPWNPMQVEIPAGSQSVCKLAT